MNPTAKKKTPVKKKDEAKSPEPAKVDDGRTLYLPALPEGYAYTSVTASGPDGRTLRFFTGTGIEGAMLDVHSADALEQSMNYSSMGDAAKVAAKAARTLAEVARREAETAKMRSEAFTL